MATVFLPGEISRHTGDIESIVIDAPRVHELMQALSARFPGAAEALARMAVAIDGEIYNDADYIDLRPESEVHLIPRIAGGAAGSTFRIENADFRNEGIVSAV